MLAIRSLLTMKRWPERGFLPALAATLLAGILTSYPDHSLAAESQTCSAEGSALIEVKVENVRSSNGLITAVLYADNPEAFLKKGRRLDRIRVEAKQGETLLCLTAPTAGRYTVAIYHDENGNKKFDRNFLGIPSEGYGFSNNPGFRFGKPEQEETLFAAEEGMTAVQIAVLYLQAHEPSGQTSARFPRNDR